MRIWRTGGGAATPRLYHELIYQPLSECRKRQRPCPRSTPNGYHTITPQLTLDDAAQTIDWYRRALGAEEISRSLGPDGKVMHAELKIGDSRFMVNDVMQGNKGPQAFG